MKEKFTKGEWKISRDLDTYEVNAETFSNGMRFRDCIADVYEQGDAHLIAAAPKMYAMLEECTIMLRTGTQEHAEECAQYVEKLLAEARGEL